RHTSPPAWSSPPEIGLNFTSTKPSASDVPLLTHHGKVPVPDCISTFDLLGAVGSAATAQRGLPRPVTPQVHPAGTALTVSLSKLTVCARAAVDASEANNTNDDRFIATPCPSHGWINNGCTTRPISAATSTITGSGNFLKRHNTPTVT